MFARKKLREFYEKIGREETLQNTYQSSLPSKMFFYQNRFTTVLKVLGDAKGKTVIDVGCGLGIYSATLALKGAKFTIALDISKNFLIKTRKLTVEKNVRDSVELVLADAEQMPFIGEIFDLVICTEVLEHLRKPSKVLKELERICKVGSRLIITIPSSYSYAEVERRRRLIRQRKPQEHLHKFTLRRFKKKLKASGFDVEDVIGCFFYFPGFAFFFNRFPVLLPALKILNWLGHAPGLNQLGWSLVFKIFKRERLI